MTDAAPPDGTLIFLDPGSQFEIRLLREDEDALASAILAPATGAGTADAAQDVISRLRASDTSAIYGAHLAHELVGAYGIERDGMANAVALIAVREDRRRRGIGRAMLQDALRRSGRRPLIAETDDEGLAFYKACGFKLVGRRVQPDGTARYRIGWHAPGVRFKGGTTGALTHEPIANDPTDPPTS